MEKSNGFKTCLECVERNIYHWGKSNKYIYIDSIYLVVSYNEQPGEAIVIRDQPRRGLQTWLISRLTRPVKETG